MAAYVGSFYDTSTQVLDGANLEQAMRLNQVVPSATNGVISEGVSVVADSQITFEHAGVYNVQFSAQITKTDSGSDDVDIWLALGGAPLDWTNTQLTVAGNNGRAVAAWNFVLRVDAGDYVELMWSSPDADMRIAAFDPATGPTRPGIPSLIVTVNRVA